MLNPLQPFTQIFAKEINDIYIMHAVRNLALSLISVFIPIYLLQQGFAWTAIGLYVLMHYLGCTVTSYFAFKVASNIGIKKTLVLSIPLKILFLISLEFAPELLGSVGGYVAAIILGLSLAVGDSMYWMPYHVEFVRFSHRKKGAQELGMARITNALAQMLAPLIGAIIIVNSSFTVTFIIIGILILVGMLPVFFTKDDHEPFVFNLKNLKHKRAFVYMAEGLYTPATSVFWPLLLYLLFTSITTAGFFFTISNMAYIIITYLISHHITAANQAKFIFAGTSTHAISVIMRIFAATPLFALAAQTLGGITRPIYSIPFHNKFYNHASQHNKQEYIYLREFYLNLGRAITCALFIVLVIIFPPETALRIGLVWSALGLLGINKKTATTKKEKNK